MHSVFLSFYNKGKFLCFSIQDLKKTLLVKWEEGEKQEICEG